MAEKVTGPQIGKKLSPFMEPESSLLHAQEPATSPYPEPDQSSPCPPSHLLRVHFNVTLPSTPRSSMMMMMMMMMMIKLIFFDRASLI